MERHHIHYDTERRSFIFPLDGDHAGYRAIVPAEFLDDELGEGSTQREREDWIIDHMVDILGAVTARMGGGIVTEPWSRVMVEETTP